jgi:hypothetical protein
MDASTSEKALGLRYSSFEDQVKEVVEHYLDLVAADEAR